MATKAVQSKVKQKDKEYRLTDDRSGSSYTIKVGRDNNLVIWDASLNQNRAIRHCPNEKSIYLEEQSDYAVVEAIVFEQGRLEVPMNRPITQAFLDAHPSNVTNGGNLFEEVNYEEEATKDIEYDDLVTKIRQAVIDKSNEKDGVNDLEMIASVLMGSLHQASLMSKNELKRVIYTNIDQDPEYFVNDEGEVTIFDDQNMRRKYMTLRAMKDGIIKRGSNNRTMVWGKDGKAIVSAPAGVDLVEFFATFLESDEGMIVAEEIDKRK